MKKSLVILIAIGSLIFLMVVSAISRYNDFVGLEEGVDSQWANVETAYQRRADLIPNLVSTVKGYAEFEQETLTQVIEARSKATSIQLNASDLTPQNLAKFQAAQDQLSGALSRLMVTVERYPELKANEQFMNLQKELTNTENKIGFERQKFNEKVKVYNGTIRTFPNKIIASMTDFEKKGYFMAEEGSEVAPKVEF